MINRSAVAIILFTILFISCSTSGHVQEDKASLPDSGGPKTVSVSAFTCPDPLIARHVQNAIIGSLLESYSVTIGGEADMVVSGDIILSNNESKISEIKAHVLKNGEKIGSVSVAGSETASDSPEEMGRMIGAKVKEVLSR